MPRVKLDSNYWKYILWNELRGHSQTEIAKILGCSQGTVSNRLRKMNFTVEELAVLNRAMGIDVRKVVDSF